MANTSKLTPKQEQFCNEYLIDLNATQAAIRAGYSKKTATEQASRLLINVKVIEYLNGLRSNLQKKTEITQQRVLDEYAKIAFFDIRRIYNDDGSLLPIKDIDDDSAAAIAGIECFEETERAGEETIVTGILRKVKITDKKGALDSICKVLGYNTPDKSQVEMAIVWQEEKTYAK